MAIADPALTLRVFLASPGDVPEERAFVRHYLDSVLPKDALLPGRVHFDVISWDDPDAGTPMPADLTPQDALLHYKGGPSGCDIVIVILAARLGTHLAIDRFARTDGSRYESGTEWEYEDAWNADPRPTILVYRRTDLVPPAFDDPQRDAKNRQFDLVQKFFERFKNQDGSAKGGYQSYRDAADFKTRLANDLRHLVRERLTSAKSISVGRPPDAAPIVRPPRCFGRDDDMRVLVTALDSDVAATLLVLGPAGIGKTTLTRQVATDPAIARRFGDRRWFVELETAKDAATMQSAIVLATGHNAATTSFASALASLARQPCLVVLDNLETPWEQDQGAVQDALQMLATAPGVSLLASLRGGGAPSSPRWTLRPTQLSPLGFDEAKRLFLELAPGLSADDPDLAEFLKELGGVPLAVELVALRAAPDSDLHELWAEWQRRRVELIAHPDLSPEHRRTSLARSLDLSWRSPRLRDEGRRLFRLLGQLPAGIADTDRAGLLGDAATEAARQLRAVGLAFARDGRLDLLPPVREYARGAHPPADPDAELWARHYLALARDVGGRIYGTDGAAALARLTPEVGNIVDALGLAAGSELRAEATLALNGVSRMWSASGAGSLAPLQLLAEAWRTTGDKHNEAECRYRLAEIAQARSDYDRARPALERARALLHDVDAVRDEAWCIARLGNIALARSEHDAARAAYQQALPLHRQVGDVVGEANCIKSLGDIALARSEHDAARAAYQQALPLYRQVGAVQGEASCIKSLGDIALARSEHDAARAAYDQALPLYRQVGDVQGEANCIQSLGDIALARSEHDAARAAYQQALPLYRQVGDVVGEANCIQRLGDIALARSEHDAARAAYQQALPLYRQVGAVQGEASCIESLGDIALARSEHDAARAAYQQALPLYRQVGAVQGEANCIKRLGDIALARSEHDAARAAYDQALPLYRQVGDVQGEANCIYSLGDIALARSEHDAARAAYQQALPLYQQVGVVQGEANCIQRLGDIALARSEHDAARAAYQQALPLYRQVGDIVGEGSCALGLGDDALAAGDNDAAAARFREALALYQGVHRTDGVALAHERLARVTDGTERTAHVAAAREAWASMDLADQVARVDREFG